MEDIIKMMAHVDITNYDDCISYITRSDVDLIMYCYSSETPGISPVIDHLRVKEIGQDIILRKRYFERYHDESCLFQAITLIIKNTFATTYNCYHDLFPYIDEYIDVVFNMYHDN